MKKYIILLLVLVLLAQPKLAPVSRVAVIKNNIMIMGTVPCQSTVWTEAKTKGDVINVYVYYKPGTGLKGCSLGGQKYRLWVAGVNANVIYVNGKRIR
jgi:hypothetical protein